MLCLRNPFSTVNMQYISCTFTYYSVSLSRYLLAKGRKNWEGESVNKCKYLPILCKSMLYFGYCSISNDKIYSKLFFNENVLADFVSLAKLNNLCR